ncbi:N-acetylmuramoyl-L-alanine amidase family protein [Kurthia huakuii]|uniref:N-acetylmuramoyl-L-alanine amidase family protein n=1 Tax=Kurthia huakuii TaxID=1421019 RepID=UPI000496DAEF|nr:N-acetylmuramoyl-L-alanine amidase [Kurthia huakuii]MBM7701099.1 N-acetylmuramoyl-L-alanine amidase [Kurthia huakuii]
MKLLFDYGHGGNDPGASYKGRKEADDVLRLGRAVAKRLRQAGVTVDETRAADTTLGLGPRVKRDKASRYDYFVSFHRNAHQPEKAHGAEVFTYPTASAKAKDLAVQLQNVLVRVGFADRGVKTANYYVLRNTRSPAVLIEAGFIDNSEDNRLFDEKFEAMVDGLAGCFVDLKVACGKI